MINAEKYKNEILEYFDKILCTRFGVDKRTKKIIQCCSQECENCEFSVFEEKNKGTPCVKSTFKWLLSEYKEPVKLTEIEYYILKYVKENTEFKYLVRLKNGNLCAYFEKPFKDKQHRVWANKENVNERLSMFNDLFEFINCEDSEPTSIQEVLSNCEVIKNESDK